MTSGVTKSGMSYSVVGTGPPLLWLSGFVLASSALERFVARFSDTYTCIVFDARGSGRTRPTKWWLSTSSMASDALEVLQHVGFDSTHIHGVSLGGMVAQELAIRSPQHVRTLVLGSTAAGGSATTPASPSTIGQARGRSRARAWCGVRQLARGAPAGHGRQHARRRRQIGRVTHPHS